MKKFKLFLVAAVMIVASVLPATAQFKWGPKIGMTVNSLHFNESVYNSENRTGFTGGLMIEGTVPLVGIGFDLSAMYVRRTVEVSGEKTTDKRDYFEIPLNLKYKLPIPLVKPFVTTGPSFGFLTSRRAVSNAFSNKSFDIAWNFGLGLELLSHLQVAASYGLGLNNSVKYKLNSNAQEVIPMGKNRVWTITAAYLF